MDKNKCPKSKFRKNFWKNKFNILNNKFLKVLKEFIY